MVTAFTVSHTNWDIVALSLEACRTPCSLLLNDVLPLKIKFRISDDVGVEGVRKS